MKPNTQLPKQPKKLITIHSGPIYVVKFNHSGEYFMSGSQDRSVCLYNPNKNIMIKHYRNLHNYHIADLDINKDNSKFITGGGDKLVMVTDVIEGKQIRKFLGHTNRITAVVYAAEDNVIISGSYDTTVKFWDNRSNSYQPLQTVKGFKDSISQIISNNFQTIVASMDGSVKFFDIRKGEITFDKLNVPIQRISISHSESAYAISTIQNKIILVQTSTGKTINSYTGHNVGQFNVDLTFTTNDSFLLTGSTDGSLYIYDLMKKTPLKIIGAHSKVLSAMNLHQNSGLVTGSHDGSIFYWKI